VHACQILLGTQRASRTKDHLAGLHRHVIYRLLACSAAPMLEKVIWMDVPLSMTHLIDHYVSVNGCPHACPFWIASDGNASETLTGSNCPYCLCLLCCLAMVPSFDGMHELRHTRGHRQMAPG